MHAIHLLLAFNKAILYKKSAASVYLLKADSIPHYDFPKEWSCTWILAREENLADVHENLQYRKLFAAILTDNGTEFSDPDMIENFRPDPEHNPAKLASRGIKVWFTDPYCSPQTKPSSRKME